MVKIIFKPAGTDEIREWNFEATDTSSLMSTWEIISLRADGKCLNEIKGSFENLPIRRYATSNTWKGELAQFIFDNL